MMLTRRAKEFCFKLITAAATGVVVALLGLIIGTIAYKGAGSLNWALITQAPKGDYYTGGGGGIANAILGSVYLGLGATFLAFVISLPTALYLRTYCRSRFATLVRGLLDVLWGVPSIVFGAFGFTLMVYLGLRASLLAGIITVAMFELPIMTRAIDVVMRMVPREIDEVSYSLGATKSETAFRAVVRQALPGIVTGVLLAFGRGIGDAASVMFTAGFTDQVPHSLSQPAATLPLAIFFQLGTPFDEVQKRAHGAALILIGIVLVTSVLSRVLSARLGRHVVK
ncbi:MAG: phosphate ABC transporter permease PstA [Armatimonadetes bacterium]|nr:phosphate ABC transporter permease PstA [Armatimonadota bacterium]